MTETLSGFFSGKRSTAAKFPEVGSTVDGVIIKVHPPEQQTDYETGTPLPGKMQVRIELQTRQRDPDIDDDDGIRTLYVKGWMTGAVADALRAAGSKEPIKGARLVVTRIEDGPSSRPGMQGPYHFTATYSPAGDFFDGNGQAADTASTNAPIPDSPPPGIDPGVWSMMPPSAKQAVANVAAGMANEPNF
jgi:hypothetical protein